MGAAHRDERIKEKWPLREQPEMEGLGDSSTPLEWQITEPYLSQTIPLPSSSPSGQDAL